jgi:hypothetical protein
MRENISLAAHTGPAQKIVHKVEGQSNKAVEFDVVVCGGTLGIFFALALLESSRGRLRIAVMERGSIKGREQVTGSLASEDAVPHWHVDLGMEYFTT